jgi:ubiquinone/menaquinone biosynthesis C-methylase UbiE
MIQENSKWDAKWNRISSNKERILNTTFTTRAYKILKKFISKKDKLILEAGCGTGRFCYLLSRDFPNSQIIGIDISDNSLKLAKKFFIQNQANLIFKKMDLFNTNYEKNTFDVVYNEGVLEHFNPKKIRNYNSALTEMKRITKIGGKIIVAVPNWYCFPHTLYKSIKSKIGKGYEYGYEKSFRHKELINLFKSQNLSKIELAAFYPAHGLKRLASYSKIFDIIGSFFDKILISRLEYIFGFEIFIKGIKIN